jgi:hypothetical protein
MQTEVSFLSSPVIDNTAGRINVPVANVADVIFRGVGVEPFHGDFVPSFVHGTMFSAPSNFLFTVLSPKDSNEPIQFEDSLTLVDSSAADYFTLIQSQGQSINQRISQSFEGKSLTISLSASEPLARAACGDESTNTYCITMDNTEFHTFSSKPFLVDPRLDLLDVLNGYERQHNQITSPSGFTFDVSSPAQHEFFEELQETYRVLVALNTLPYRHLVTDLVPDSFSFAFSTLAPLALQAGSDSLLYTNARLVLKDALLKFDSLAHDVYPDALVEMAFLPSVPPGAGPSRHLLQSSTTSTSVVTSADVETFQIATWFSISWFFALFFTVTGIAGLRFKKDTMMYGDFNPDWSASRGSGH